MGGYCWRPPSFSGEPERLTGRGWLGGCAYLLQGRGGLPTARTNIRRPGLSLLCTVGPLHQPALRLQRHACGLPLVLWEKVRLEWCVCLYSVRSCRAQGLNSKVESTIRIVFHTKSSLVT